MLWKERSGRALFKTEMLTIFQLALFIAAGMRRCGLGRRLFSIFAA